MKFSLFDSVTNATLVVEVEQHGSFLNIRPVGYDNPVSLDFYAGRLRVLVDDDATMEDTQITDLERAK